MVGAQKSWAANRLPSRRKRIPCRARAPSLADQGFGKAALPTEDCGVVSAEDGASALQEPNTFARQRTMQRRVGQICPTLPAHGNTSSGELKKAGQRGLRGLS